MLLSLLVEETLEGADQLQIRCRCDVVESGKLHLELVRELLRGDVKVFARFDASLEICRAQVDLLKGFGRHCLEGVLRPRLFTKNVWNI